MSPVECTYTEPMTPGDVVLMRVRVIVPEATPSQTVQNHVSVEGGGAPTLSTGEPTTMPNTIDSSPPAFGLQDFSLAATATTEPPISPRATIPTPSPPRST